jgi:hypothetical protein
LSKSSGAGFFFKVDGEGRVEDIAISGKNPMAKGIEGSGLLLSISNEDGFATRSVDSMNISIA